MSGAIAFAGRPRPPGPSPFPIALRPAAIGDLVLSDGAPVDARTRRRACVALHEAGWVVVPLPPSARGAPEAALDFARRDPGAVAEMLDRAARTEDVLLVFETEPDVGPKSAPSPPSRGRDWLRRRAERHSEAERHAEGLDRWCAAVAVELDARYSEPMRDGGSLAVRLTLPRGRAASPAGRVAMAYAPPLPAGIVGVTAIGPLPALGPHAPAEGRGS